MKKVKPVGQYTDEKNQIEPKVRIEMRSAYPEFFAPWKDKYLSAQHRFVDLGDGAITMSIESNPIIQSADGGKTWHKYEGRVNLPSGCTRGLFKRGDEWIAIEGGIELFRSYDAGITWSKGVHIPSADDVHFDGLRRPNVFSIAETRRGDIVIVADNFLGQEGPGGQLINSVVSHDFGYTWHVSRLFGPADPLPNGPEGFGEPAVVEMPSTWLWMVMRSQYGELWQCISQDYGRTWNHPTPTGLVSPISNCYATRMPESAATVLCWNNTIPGIADDFKSRTSLYRPRTNLVFAISRDNCRRWTVPVTVEKGNGVYPTIHFTDKEMLIMYQSYPKNEPHAWEKKGLTLVVYDLEEVNKLEPWTIETIKPLIDQGLVRHWLTVNCRNRQQETIT